MSRTDLWTVVETGPWWMDLKCTKCGRLWEFTTEEAINAMNFLECKCGEEDHSVEG